MLKYSFIFDPAETWAQQYEFDASLAAYLKTLGFEAELVKTGDEKSTDRLLIINKSKEVTSDISRERTVKQVVTSLGQRRADTGKFEKTNA